MMLNGLGSKVFGGGAMVGSIDPMASDPDAPPASTELDPIIALEAKENLDLTSCKVSSAIVLLLGISKPAMVVAPSEGVMVVTNPSNSMLLTVIPPSNSNGISLEASPAIRNLEKFD